MLRTQLNIETTKWFSHIGDGTICGAYFAIDK